MGSVDRWREEVFKVFNKVKSHKDPYEVEVEGIKIQVLPNVFSPRYFTDSIWFAKEVSEIVGQNSLLEVGTGTGIIALFCARNGAKVVAVDVNPDAVKNAQLNFQTHNLDGSVRRGDVYEPIKEDEKFDFIFWNHPFNNWSEEVDDILLRAGFDTNYASLRKYVVGARNYLSSKGRLLLGTGSFADIDEIQKIAEENKYNLNLLREAEFPVEEGSKVLNKYLIYEFQG